MGGWVGGGGRWLILIAHSRSVGRSVRQSGRRMGDLLQSAKRELLGVWSSYGIEGRNGQNREGGGGRLMFTAHSRSVGSFGGWATSCEVVVGVLSDGIEVIIDKIEVCVWGGG